MIYAEPPKTRAEALRAGVTKYFTGEPCKHGHLSNRKAHSSECIACSKEYLKKFHLEKPEKAKGYRRTFNSKPENKLKQNTRARSEPSKLRRKLWYTRNVVRLRQYSLVLKKKHRRKHTIRELARHKRNRVATPLWVQQQELREIYSKCPKGFHVDHSVPLNGKTLDGGVCGLHVPWNLQYLTASENLTKGNKYDET